MTQVHFPRIRAQRKSPRGFTSWRKAFRLLECCDCGLVHEIEYRVDSKQQVQQRIRRAQGHTIRQRKLRGPNKWQR